MLNYPDTPTSLLHTPTDMYQTERGTRWIGEKGPSSMLEPAKCIGIVNGRRESYMSYGNTMVDPNMEERAVNVISEEEFVERIYHCSYFFYRCNNEASAQVELPLTVDQGKENAHKKC